MLLRVDLRVTAALALLNKWLLESGCSRVAAMVAAPWAQSISPNIDCASLIALARCLAIATQDSRDVQGDVRSESGGVERSRSVPQSRLEVEWPPPACHLLSADVPAAVLRVAPPRRRGCVGSLHLVLDCRRSNRRVDMLLIMLSQRLSPRQEATNSPRPRPAILRRRQTERPHAAPRARVTHQARRPRWERP
jgi:hypothetical protein